MQGLLQRRRPGRRATRAREGDGQAPHARRGAASRRSPRSWRSSTCRSTTRRGSALGAERRRQRTLEAVKRVVLRESRAQPLLLVLEDLHWIDDDTQALLESLVESLPSRPRAASRELPPRVPPRVGRQELLHPDPPRPAGGGPRRGAARSASRRELASWRRSTSLLIARTEGNPFFLEESVRALAESGVAGR